MISALARRAVRVTLSAERCSVPAAFSTNAEKVPQYETLAVTVPKPFVYHVELNRPKKMNAMTSTMWNEIGNCFDTLAENEDCRVVILSGAGKIFCSGIDLGTFMNLGEALGEVEDIARKCKIFHKNIKVFQECMTALEKCPKPVIGAVHSACIGAGVDLVTATDIRYCTTDAWFQVKEIDIGMAADVGTLQRLPKVIGSQSLVRELALTARKLEAAEAKESGLVSKVFDNYESLMKGAVTLAEDIASRSPVAVQLSKRNLIYSRDHTVQEGLDNIRDWNQVMLQSEDFLNAVMAQASKEPQPPFAKL